MKCKICGNLMVKHYPKLGFAFDRKTMKQIQVQVRQHWLCQRCQWMELENLLEVKL